MTLKAVLFGFNGVVLDDESIHQQLVDQILLSENLRPQADAYWQFCLGRSDRLCLTDLLTSRGRVVSEAHLESLVAQKAESYQRHLATLAQLPLFPGVVNLVSNLGAAQLKLAIVSGALRSEITAVLKQAGLFQSFPVVVAGDDPVPSKPKPDCYLLAVERLNLKYPALNLNPGECLAIEDSFAGIEAAKHAKISLVGVANTYPFHMLQRHTDWTVDSLRDLELERIQSAFRTDELVR